jgi:hypothetical protein
LRLLRSPGTNERVHLVDEQDDTAVRRRQLHTRVAATLESRFPESVAAEPAILARHCTEAGLLFLDHAVEATGGMVTHNTVEQFVGEPVGVFRGERDPAVCASG